MPRGSLCSLGGEGRVSGRPPATQAPRGTTITTISTAVVLKWFKESATRVTKVMMGTDTVTLSLITQVWDPSCYFLRSPSILFLRWQILSSNISINIFFSRALPSDCRTAPATWWRCSLRWSPTRPSWPSALAWTLLRATSLSRLSSGQMFSSASQVLWVWQ